jgi:predicted MFS family arabinose efflux permease
MVYAGLLMGSVVSALVFDRYATKQIIVSTLLCYILSLSFILLSRNMFILAASRLAVGLFQVIIVIYLPVWVDVRNK